ncbi:MAG TPA: hypothetical protein VI248_20070, partial [Kineosporiaceae bacterium]
RIRPLRVGLVAVAVLQVLAVLWPLVAGGAARSHAGQELSSFGLALAVGFCAAAVRPGRAWGMLPVITAAAACLVGTAALDVVLDAGRNGGHGDVHVLAEVPHLLAVVGALLLWWLSRVQANAGLPCPQRSLRPAGLRWFRSLLAGTHRPPPSDGGGRAVASVHPSAPERAAS